MQGHSVVGFSGNFTRPSKTRAFVSGIVETIAARYGLDGATYDIEDLGASFPPAKWAAELDPQAGRILEAVVGAKVLVVGTPTYKGSYTGLFKHFFDLIDPAALRGKPVLLTATGGGERHMLLMEHQLRPLFAFFEALSMPTSIYATEKDFADGVPVSPGIVARIEQGVAQIGAALSNLDAVAGRTGPG